MNDFSVWFWVILGIVVFIIIAPILFGIAIMGFQTKVALQHEQSRIVKYGYVGYSLTYLIFGWIVPIVRGEILIGVLHLVITFVSFGLFQLIMPYLYNKQYTTRLLTSGWVLADTEEMNRFARSKLNITL
jgi:hypothetical protein